MSRWDDEHGATMTGPHDAGTGGAWAVSDLAGGPESNDPTIERQLSSSSAGRAGVKALATGQCPDENLLVDLAEGKIQGADRLAIDRHLDGCAECSRLVIELAKLATPARSAPKRYQVIRQLGAGAMGVVWEAEDTHLHRKVALKFVKPEGVDDKALRKRLLREARALAQVRHPNVMAVYDAGEADDEICLVLELINGSTARAWRAAKPRTTDEIVAVWRQAAAGLAAVHRVGIVHRDIKPDNVFVSDDGRVLIGDFGLARGGDLVDTTTTDLTVTGAMIGTPLYMSPEQLHGATATKKSDQFALCASIWEGVVDERPFRGSTIAAIVLAMQKVPELPKSATPEQRRVLAILQKGLDPDPAKRFDDIEGLVAALATPVKRPSRVPLWIGIGAVGLAVGGTALVLAATRGPKEAPAQPAPAPAPPNPPNPTNPNPTNPNPANPNPTDPAIPPTHSTTSGSNDATGSGARATTANGGGMRVPKSATSKLDVKDDKGQTRRFDQPASPPPVAQGSGSAAPSVDPANSSYTHLMMRAADKLTFGDGAGCLKLLDNLPELPDDELRRVELIRANCRMATGDCVGAAAAIEVTGKKLGWDGNQIKTTTEAADKAYCPIDAPPEARWPERAQYRLQLAAGLGRSCKAILDTIAKHHIVLPDTKSTPFLEVQCLVNAGDCKTAEQKYLAWLSPNVDPATQPQVVADRAKSFHATFKKCP